MLEPRRIELARLPTPMVPLSRLGGELGGARILLKRDDLTGLEFSGNKIRKLEFVVAEAVDAGCDTIVTEGTSQSNHCRATAAVCARLGLHAFLLFRPPPAIEPQVNHFLDALFGAQTRSFSREQYSAQRERIVAETLEQLRATGQTPRFTPAGASEPLGCWGYMRAAAEIAGQLRAEAIHECDVVVALSSGGTYAGLLLGQALHWQPGWRLWAVPVSDDVVFHRREITALCESTIIRFDLPIDFKADSIQMLDGYVGDGYAVPYPEAIEAIQLAARTEAVILDPVYTAKAFCAVLDGVRDGRFGRRSPVIFIHTGGVFSNFAWPRALLATAGADGAAR